ncbi:MAG: DUF262 domain-containing protein [Campylobacterales bacterium]|nr:DUF262 domain-containing protein [Campylobacterales bacterium]
MIVDQNIIENQINEQRKEVDFDTREFTIEILVKKYTDEIDTDNNELFVPEYQREFVWDEQRQSRLIESVILGLPIPIIFVAETKEGRLEIVDGSQRIRTLAEFIQNSLVLTDLERLTHLNGLSFLDLPKSRQRKVNNTPVRMVVLSETTSDQVKNDLFERINRGSDLLRNMEKRKGIYRGEFNKFIYEVCAKKNLLNELAPLEKSVQNRQEHEELVLRFFALIDTYPKFRTHKRGIGAMLDEYFGDKNETFSKEERLVKERELNNVLSFVKENFPYGFSKKKGAGVSRVFFEAVSVGVYLALKEKADMKLKEKVNINYWLQNKQFQSNIRGKFKTHTPERLKERIDFVKSKLLELSV